jgi:hypothetical protein
LHFSWLFYIVQEFFFIVGTVGSREECLSEGAIDPMSKISCGVKFGSHLFGELIFGKGIPLVALLLCLCLGVSAPPASLGAQAHEPQSKSGAIVSPVVLHGAVTDELYPQLEQRAHELIEIAVAQNEDADLLGRKTNHYNKALSRVWAGTKDLAELLTEYKGFEQSSEAADVILGEKLKLKSKAASEYAQQLKRDRAEIDVLTAMIEIAEGLGCSDKTQSQDAVDLGLEHLRQLAGEEEASKTLRSVKDCCASAKADPAIFQQPPVKILEIEEQSKNVLASAMKADSVVNEITETLHKRYNRRSNLARVSAKVVNGTLSIAGYSPTIISPVAQLAWTIYIATQGGPEESKLLKEVYLSKRFASRYETLTRYASLAVNGRNLAIVNKNVELLAFSEWMLSRVSGQQDQTESADTLKPMDAAVAPSQPALAASKVETK